VEAQMGDTVLSSPDIAKFSKSFHQRTDSAVKIPPDLNNSAFSGRTNSHRLKSENKTNTIYTYTYITYYNGHSYMLYKRITAVK